jgi:hypothetical protein
MDLAPAQLEFLRTPLGQELCETELPEDELSALTRLRRECSPDQAAAVVEIRDLRRRAAAKFPGHIASELLATDTLLQQASSFALAGYLGGEMVGRFGSLSAMDLCCGLGADAIGMAMAGMDVTGLDNNESAVICASHNAGIAGVVDRCNFKRADVRDVDIEGVVHIDPDRRTDRRRSVSISNCEPGEEFLRGLVDKSRAGCMKLSPMMDFRAFDDWDGLSLEYVSEKGTCKQLLCWWGVEDLPRRSAVVVGDETTRIEAGESESADIREPGEWLIEPDPALTAAWAIDDLAIKHGLWRLHRSVTWLSGDRAVDTPLARSFRIVADCAGREKDVAALLKDVDAGEVAVKTRGVDINTDRMQKKLRGRGERRLVVFWARFGKKEKAFIAEPGE